MGQHISRVRNCRKCAVIVLCGWPALIYSLVGTNESAPICDAITFNRKLPCYGWGWAESPGTKIVR